MKEKTDRQPAAATVKTYKKPSPEEIKKKLTDLQYQVTQQEGTESSFNNEYWNIMKRESMLMWLRESRCSVPRTNLIRPGWPSYTRLIATEAITVRKDKKLNMERVEVRSRSGDSHLGNLFNDGPADKGGLRYCMNSASLRFVPLAKWRREGYAEVIPLVK